MYLQGSVLLCVGAQLDASKIVSSSLLSRARFSKQSLGDIVLRVNILSKIIGILSSLDANIVVFEWGYSEQLNNLMVIPRAMRVATRASIPMTTGQEMFSSVRNETALEKNCFKTILLNSMISINYSPNYRFNCLKWLSLLFKIYSYWYSNNNAILNICNYHKTCVR